MIIKGYLLIYSYLALILFISYILDKKFKVKKILTRKFVHISVSFYYVISYYFFGNSLNIIIPPLTFIILNIYSYKYKLFSGMEDNSESLGTIYYPLSAFIMSLITYFYHDFYSAYGIGLFCMAFADGLAPIIANKIKSKKIYNDKTISGSIGIMIISLIVILIFNILFKMNFSLIEMITISILSGILELLGKKGTDNLLLPLGLSLITYVMEVI
jgi:phytol kinase